MPFHRLSFLSLTAMSLFGATSAWADQCAVLNREQAVAAAALLQRNEEVMHFCEPCGENILLVPPAKIEKIRSVQIKPWEGDKKSFVVEVNGRQTDLAYLFLTTAELRPESGLNEKVRFNVGRMAGCESSDTSIYLRGRVSFR